jgi:RNA polymerase sigma factor (TIGR02999 family)
MNKQDKKLQDIPEPITKLIQQVKRGDQQARERLWGIVLPLLEGKARNMLNGDRVAGVMRPSDLSQDALKHLIQYEKIGWNDRKHLFAFAAEVMRHIVVNNARKHLKKDHPMLMLDEAMGIEFNNQEDWVEVDLALKKLAHGSKAGARLAKVIALRIFAGFSLEDIAYVTEISRSQVKRDITLARTRLMELMQE